MHSDLRLLLPIRIGVHFHKNGKQVQSEEDLGGPAPVANERVSLYWSVYGTFQDQSQRT
jgi:hypothetical protein